VAAPSLNASELRFLRALLRRKVRFMVVGLSAAALQGAPVVTQDVDLWFEDLNDPRIGEALREVDAAYVPPSILNPPMFAGGGSELFDDQSIWALPNQIDRNDDYERAWCSYYVSGHHLRSELRGPSSQAD